MVNHMPQNVYTRNFLEEVVFQVRYSPILELITTEKGVASKFQKIVSKEFPDVKCTHNKKVNFKINAITGESVGGKFNEDFLIWEFSNNYKKVKLSGDELILSYSKGNYSSFDELCHDVELILTALKEYMEPKINSIGLRYINRINCIDTDDELKEYINPKLVVNEIFNNDILQSLCRLEFKIDKYFLAFQYGQFNPEYPNINGKKEFILDYDCILRSVKIDDILSNLESMNNIIVNKFEDCIQDKLRNYMGVNNAN